MNFVPSSVKAKEWGIKRIDTVRISDAKIWLIKLQQEGGRGYSSIHTIRGVVRPAFQMAVDDDLIRKNPFGFQLVDVIVNDSVRREAMPKVTSHVCRHTYCSNMARSGMNPKTLQYLMGHSDIGVTLNTYTHLGLEDAKEEVFRLQNVM